MIDFTEENRQVMCAALLVAAEVEDKLMDRYYKACGKTVDEEKLKILSERINVSFSRYQSYLCLLRQLMKE